jgi:hypothetical protein
MHLQQWTFPLFDAAVVQAAYPHDFVNIGHLFAESTYGLPSPHYVQYLRCWMGIIIYSYQVQLLPTPKHKAPTLTSVSLNTLHKQHTDDTMKAREPSLI